MLYNLLTPQGVILRTCELGEECYIIPKQILINRLELCQHISAIHK